MAGPGGFENVEEVEEALSRPDEGVVETMKRLSGDVIVLGVAGKMGPTLARMIVRGSQDAGVKRRVIGVARFSNPGERAKLESYGIETIKADLLDEAQLAKLPDAPNVVYMPAMKFGSTGQEGMTWAMNTFLAGVCSQKYSRSKIVAFSTGNVYGLCPVARGGSLETDMPGPIGDYAMSCLGRERLFDYFSRVHGIKVALIRLNYAVEMRYGVLVDIAQKVWQDKEIDVSMGHMNAIWQCDANAMTLRSFDHVSSPPFILNVTGPEMLSFRKVAEEFGTLMGKKVKIVGKEAGDALIANASKAHKLFGKPQVSAQQMIHWIADWVMNGKESLGKPTHFETRDGKY
jgi:nucleoside-diphosphate-sugar epimerase